mgnify:CR=1 FL=1
MYAVMKTGGKQYRVTAGDGTSRSYRVEVTAAPARHPAVERDLAIVVPEDQPAGQVAAVIVRSAGPLLRDVALFEVGRPATGEHVLVQLEPEVLAVAAGRDHPTTQQSPPHARRAHALEHDGIAHAADGDDSLATGAASRCARAARSAAGVRLSAGSSSDR